MSVLRVNKSANGFPSVPGNLKRLQYELAGFDLMSFVGVAISIGHISREKRDLIVTCLWEHRRFYCGFKDSV